MEDIFLNYLKLIKELFYVSDISDVFGAMDSWNDSPPCYDA